MRLLGSSFIPYAWYWLTPLRANPGAPQAVWQEALWAMWLILASGLSVGAALEPLKGVLRDRAGRTSGDAETAPITELVT